LALFTRGLQESNTLRIYDISRKNGRQPISTIDLDTFAKEGEDDDGGEVNCTAFSPDGIYLAVARNDNIVHVYDSRNLERGVLHCFQHKYPNREVAGFKGFGVVEAQWVTSFDGRGLGLISGGNDGMITQRLGILYNSCWLKDVSVYGTLVRPRITLPMAESSRRQILILPISLSAINRRGKHH
jgi:hypothetical protein